jgi:type I restriction enzyme M protein
VVVDKQDAHTRKGIFMIDASAGFMKDGPKNRLRAQDIHQIVDVFIKRLDVPKYSRMVSVDEIEKNEFNLNLPRYIDSQQAEDLQNIEGHLKGGIPQADVEALQRYWDVCSNLQQTLFKANRPGYLDLAVEKSGIKSTIYEHPEFASFIGKMNAHFAMWQQKTAKLLRTLKPDCHPKEVIVALSEGLLAHYAGQPLIDKYDVYQHLMDYWAETMQDDCYLIAADGWKAETTRIIEKDKKGKEKDKGWTCDLVPKSLIVANYFAKEQEAIDRLAAELESTTARLTELEEEHGGDEGAFSELDKVNKANVAARLKELQRERKTDSSSSFPRRRESSASNNLDARFHGHDGAAAIAAEDAAPYGDDSASEMEALLTWLKLNIDEADLKKRLKETEAALDAKAYAKYPTLTESEIKQLAVDDKWLAALDKDIHGEMDRVSQQLTQRVKELAERYETPMPQMVSHLANLEDKVNRHLAQMGFPTSGEWTVESGK